MYTPKDYSLHYNDPKLGHLILGNPQISESRLPWRPQKGDPREAVKHKSLKTASIFPTGQNPRYPEISAFVLI